MLEKKYMVFLAGVKLFNGEIKNTGMEPEVWSYTTSFNMPPPPQKNRKFDFCKTFDFSNITSQGEASYKNKGFLTDAQVVLSI